MCGIVGFFRPVFEVDRFVDRLCPMLAMLRHRGPDEMGYYFDDMIALGVARLSIIDLQQGQQPLCDSSGRYWIAYNGEIYNYLELRRELELAGRKFSTLSDTEVLINAWIEWGSDALNKLNGAFAFAIYDSLERSLVLGRDRYGERPLFYFRHRNALYFASEIKALQALPEVPFELDSEILKSIATVWTPVGNQTAFRQIEQVPHGTWVSVIDGEFTVRRYHALFETTTPPCPSEGEAEDALHSLLSESVALRLRSDVEVGAYLSGGLDSTIVTQLALDNGARSVRTYSVTFDDSRFDESTFQDVASAHLGTTHSRVHVSNRDIAAEFPAALWHAETPTFRTAFVPMFLLSKLVQQDGVKVVLTGEGADEVFLGYNIFKECLVRRRLNESLPAVEQRKLISELYPYLPHFSESNARYIARLFQEHSDERHFGLFSHEIRFANSSLTSRLVKGAENGLDAIQAQVDAQRELVGRLSPVARGQWLEFNTLLAGYLLSTQGDRMTMAHSVESRCPFLDPNVVEWAHSQPLDYKLKNGNLEKHILKAAFLRDLPRAIVERPKQPYRAPNSAAFLGKDPPDYLESVLSGSELAKLDFLEHDLASRLVRKVTSTSPDLVSPREDQAFIFLLSLGVIHSQFCGQRQVSPLIEDILIRRIDGRCRLDITQGGEGNS